MKAKIIASTGASSKKEIREAVEEAIGGALKELRKKGAEKPKFALVYSSVKYNLKKLIKEIDEKLDCQWVGCTTDGSFSDKGLKFGGLSVMLIYSDFLEFGIGVGENVSKNPKKAGRDAVKKAIKALKVNKEIAGYIDYLATKKSEASDWTSTHKMLFFVIPPGFTIKERGFEEEILEGITSEVGIYAPIFGGSAGDDIRFLKTYQFANGKLYEDSVIVTSIYVSGNIKTSVIISHSFEPTDKVAVVTKSDGYIVKELNGVNAAEYYAKMLGTTKEELTRGASFLDLGKKLPSIVMKIAQSAGLDIEKTMKKMPFYKFVSANPFGIADYSGDYVLRVPKSITKEGYLEFYNRIPKNTALTLMKINMKKTKTLGREILEKAQEKIKNISMALLFECTGRLAILGEEAEKEVNGIKRKFKFPFIGYYSRGELGASLNKVVGNHTYSLGVVCFGGGAKNERGGKK